MKLIFYILDVNEVGEPFLLVKECEAYEKDGLIWSTENHFPYSPRKYIMHGDIGRLMVSPLGREIPKLILTESDITMAKQLFSEYVNKKIESHKRSIKAYENKLRVIEEAKE